MPKSNGQQAIIHSSEVVRPFAVLLADERVDLEFKPAGGSPT
jgi:hypothetical protein